MGTRPASRAYRSGFCRGGSPGLRVSVSPTSVRQTQPLSVSPPPPPRPGKPALSPLVDGWSQDECEGIGRQLGKRCCHDQHSRPDRGKVARRSAGAPERRWQLPAHGEGKITFLELRQLAYEMQPAARKGSDSRSIPASVVVPPAKFAALAPGPAGPNAPPSPETFATGALPSHERQESPCSDDDRPAPRLQLVLWA
jgi:hypothetical protein